ncbi:hypothetical protein [Aquabacterium sp.]|uniref:hypothetical protein n=1 Tax=Aquabacterium sp. TaxID=1872578 RepID=UPI004038406C
MSTRILMSFAMADGGMMFVQWLRNKLMAQYGLFSTDSVYVDFVSARSGNAYYGTTPDNALPDYATVKPDTRAHMRSATNAMPIGAMHPQWKDMLEKAMDEAEVVLFILTKQFLESQWCIQELKGFKEVLGKRMGVKGIVLDLDGTGFNPATYGLPAERISILQGAREAHQGGMLWDKGLWCISEGTYGKLVTEIGAHSEWREG